MDMLSKKEHFIKAEIQPFWLEIFDYSFTKMVKKAFYSMRVKNAENFDLRNPEKGSLLFSSHCCWWDGQIGFLLSKKVLNTRLHMMIEELYRFPLLSKIGAFSVEKKSSRLAIESLNYSIELLQKPENSLWIFPQGFVMPPDYRPVKFANGISYICNKLEGVNLIPVAHRYNFIREDRPEIFIEIGNPIIINDAFANRKELTKYLEAKLISLLDKQKQDVSNGNFEGYKTVIKSELCVAKKIEKYFTGFVRSFNT